MNYVEYIKGKMSELNILSEYEELVLLVDTYTTNDGRIKYNISTGEWAKKNFLIDKYIYIYSAYIEAYGIDIEHVEDVQDILQNYNDGCLCKTTGSYTIETPKISIKNNIKNLKPTLSFHGEYSGDYADINIIDLNWSFYIVLSISGVKEDNWYFKTYRDSLGKLLECIEALQDNKLELAFNAAYTSLELFIKKIKEIEFLTPTDTKKILIDEGFDKYKAKKIIRERNDKIHPKEYGYFEDEDTLKKTLKYILKAYFYIFRKYH